MIDDGPRWNLADEFLKLSRELQSTLETLEQRGVTVLPGRPQDVGLEPGDELPGALSPTARRGQASTGKPLFLQDNPLEDSGKKIWETGNAARLPEVAPPQSVAVQGKISLPSADLAREGRLKALEAQALECRRCPLAQGRHKVVFGTGDADARLMLVGEGPGAEEDQTGKPFVGRAGRLLTKVLSAIGIRREDVYITNVVKCRPPGNREPTPEESKKCRAFLDAQLDIIQPDVIVCLGRVAAQNLLGETKSLGQLRLRIHSYGKTALIVSYHPAFLLRSPSKKRDSWEDLKLIANLLREKGIAIRGLESSGRGEDSGGNVT